jgi:hypothetical protein
MVCEARHGLQCWFRQSADAVVAWTEGVQS